MDADDKKEDVEKSLGITCPSCGCGHCPVYKNRRYGWGVRRNRECRFCGRRFVTTERKADD